MLEVLGEDYIRTARAKGLTERRVVYRHAMRSAIPPLVTQLGTDIGLMLGGVIVIEQVFGLLGVGSLAVQFGERTRTAGRSSGSCCSAGCSSSSSTSSSTPCTPSWTPGSAPLA